MAQTLIDRLNDHAARHPSDIAITFLTTGDAASEDLTYAQLREAALGLSGALQAHGLQGRRVLLCFPSGLPFVTALLACMYAGAVPVPVAPPRARDDSGFRRIERIARDCSAIAILCTDQIFDAHRFRNDPAVDARWLSVPDLGGGASAPAAVSVDDIAFLQYTSGSTAEPRGVIVTHANLASNIAATTEFMGIDAATVFVSWLPLHHDMGLIGMLLQAVYGGNRLVLMSPQHFLQRPRRWLEAMDRFGGHLSGAPNFAYDLCVKRVAPETRAALDLSRWRVAFNGAEPVRASTLAAFGDAFAVAGFSRGAFFPCYGLAETTLYAAGGFASQSAHVIRFDSSELSAGRARAAEAAAGVDLAGCGAAPSAHAIIIADPATRKPMAPGEVGEILITGPSVARGYWGAAAATKDTFQVRVPGDDRDFLATGDLGFLWQAELFVTGRLKDTLLLRGRNIYPQDIELTAETCDPSAPINGCVAFADDVGGEERLVVIKEVRHEHSPTLASLGQQIARRVLEEHEIQPFRVVLTRLGAIPRTSSGKVRRRASRETLAAGLLPILVDHRAAVPRLHPAGQS